MTQQVMPIGRNRFGNSVISELHQANRNTISGYQDLPLMSLEEAVQSIVPFVPHVMSYADTAKKFCRQNTTLSINESAAIYLYTMPIPFYKNLNKTFRAENPHALKPWFAFLKLFITALRKLPSHPTTVWRGVGGNIGADFAENDVHTWWSVNSCSSYVNVAGMFAGETGTLFCINVIHGKDITAYSANQSEEEIILMPGTRLCVKGMRPEPNGLSIVHLEEEW
jgi:hypothetical protein